MEDAGALDLVFDDPTQTLIESGKVAIDMAQA